MCCLLCHATLLFPSCSACLLPRSPLPAVFAAFLHSRSHPASFLTPFTQDGLDNFEVFETGEDEDGSSALPPMPLTGPDGEEIEGAPDPDLADGKTFQLARRKTTPMHSGCDPQNSEKVSSASPQSS